LNFIENENFRKILEKGSNSTTQFRNWKYILLDYVEVYARTWATREKENG